MYRVSAASAGPAVIECDKIEDAVTAAKALNNGMASNDAESNGVPPKKKRGRPRGRKATRPARNQGEATSALWAHAKRVAKEQGRKDVAQVRSEISAARKNAKAKR